MTYIKLNPGPNFIDNANTVRACMASMKGDDELSLGRGMFDFGLNPGLRLSPGLSWYGKGRDRTICKSSAWQFSSVACAFELNAGVSIEGMSLISDVKAGQQSQTVGFGAKNAPSSIQARLKDLYIEGHSFAIYAWLGSGNKLEITDVQVRCGHWGVVAGAGSGPDAQHFDLRNVDIDMDYDLLRGAGGDHGGQCCALVVRGGRTVVRGGSIYVAGGATGVDLAACVAVQAGPWGGGPEDYPDPSWPAVEIHDVACRVKPGAGTRALDVYQDIGRFARHGGSGSGANGAWLEALKA
jgi:hypothetical protein